MKADFILPYIRNAREPVFRVISENQRHTARFYSACPAMAPIAGGSIRQVLLPQKDSVIPARTSGAFFRNLHE
ncbi:MAG: hypothetical protein BWY09_00653 [Candidatus Hydrogenedentes bacterium ADurb.Bin179]|nr:MAG: hypothetical protein BWY09_00653 [Candidatus Hydrogenedentes bacterium ADurb.Bin179]